MNNTSNLLVILTSRYELYWQWVSEQESESPQVVFDLLSFLFGRLDHEFGSSLYSLIWTGVAVLSWMFFRHFSVRWWTDSSRKFSVFSSFNSTLLPQLKLPKDLVKTLRHLALERLTNHLWLPKCPFGPASTNNHLKWGVFCKVVWMATLLENWNVWENVERSS